MLNRLQYISQGIDAGSHLENIHSALDAGVKFVQLRLKNYNEATYIEAGLAAKEMCDKYSATLVINDLPLVADRCNANAVHLGLGDMTVEEARKKSKVTLFGGTANTFEHIQLRYSELVDYIGLGPFRFTNTKEKLSPVLGLEGYRSIMARMNAHSIDTPVYAIGGIEFNDVKSLMQCGVYGIAVSGMITRENDKVKLINELNKILNHA